jgi:MFS family permease
MHDAPSETKPVTWADLLSGRHVSVVTVIASGVLLYAMNLFFTAALMPTIVADIGGLRYYSWITIAFTIAAIGASLFVSRVLEWRGVATAYTLALSLFAAGAFLAATSPRMELLVIARLVQGLGGGLLAGLGYAVIRTVLPQKLWARATGLTSAMWGFGTLVGPSLGGLFAEFGLWRMAYSAVGFAALLLVILVRRRLGGQATVGGRSPLPLASLVPLVLSAGAISVVSILPVGWLTMLALAAGGGLFTVFIVVERNAVHPILPRMTFAKGNPLKWIYLTVASLTSGVMLENFVPLFGQQLAGLRPVAASLLGVAMSLAWVVAQLYSATLTGKAARTRAIWLGPTLLASALAVYGASQAADAGLGEVLAWAVTLGAAGVGIGIAWPQLGIAAMSSSDDPVEGRKAAAAVTTVQMLALSTMAAIAGLLMNAGGDVPELAAALVAFGMALMCLPGVVVAWLVARDGLPDNA